MSTTPPSWQRVIARRNHPIPPASELNRISMSPDIGPFTALEAAAFLEGLAAVDIVQLHQGVPPISWALHTREVRYRRDLTLKHWRTLREVWEHRGGTCADFAAAVVAELRVFQGVFAKPVIYKSRPGMWHAVVQLPDGTVIDPSRTGGMLDHLPISEPLARALGLDRELGLRR